MKENFKKYLVELIGTFFLVFTIGCTVLVGGNGVIPPIAIGFILMVMVYAGGHISGGHYNPAVSLGACIRGALPLKNLLQYWVSQFIGAALASLVIIKFLAKLNCAPVNTFNLENLVIAEFLFTFALVYVVLMTATTKTTEGNSYFGLSIGSTVMAGAFAVGGICLAAFNPAVALAVGILHLATWKIVAITAFTNLIAGVIAALIFKFVYTEK